MKSKGKWTCNVPISYATQSLRIVIRLGGVYRAACLMAELNGALIRKVIKKDFSSQKPPVLNGASDELNTALIRNPTGLNGASDNLNTASNAENELLPDHLISNVPSFSLPEFITTPLVRALEIEISRWELPFDEGGEGGFVPSHAWPALLSAARLDGLVLSSEDLDPRLSPVYKPLPNVQKAYLHAHDIPPPPDDPTIREYIAGHFVSTRGAIYPIRKRRKKKYAPKLE